MDFVPQTVDAAIEALFEPRQDERLENACQEVSDRGFPRIPFRGRSAAIVLPPPANPTEEPVESEVVTTDISRGGLSILHRTELHPGQQLILQLRLRSCTVEVCWCCEVWAGLYIAGCRFVDPAFPDSVL